MASIRRIAWVTEPWMYRLGIISFHWSVASREPKRDACWVFVIAGVKSEHGCEKPRFKGGRVTFVGQTLDPCLLSLFSRRQCYGYEMGVAS